LLAEELACRYLKKQGFIILKRNWRVPSGELDIMCLLQDCLICVEVKMRSVRDRNSHAALTAAKDELKKERILRALQAYLYRHQRYINRNRIRFIRGDVFTVQQERSVLYCQFTHFPEALMKRQSLKQFHAA
jgi:putative endonuclease